MRSGFTKGGAGDCCDEFQWLWQLVQGLNCVGVELDGSRGHGERAGGQYTDADGYIFAPELWSAVETMAYFLTIDGVCHVRVATSFKGDEKAEHPWILRRIREFGGGIEIALTRGARAKSAVYLSPTEGPLSWQDWLREQ